MRPVTQAQTGTGNTTAILLDNYIAPFSVGFGVVVSGTVTYTVQHTFDGTNWYNHPTVAAQTTNQDGNYAFPVTGIRLNVSAGGGTATLTAIQAGVA